MRVELENELKKEWAKLFPDRTIEKIEIKYWMRESMRNLRSVWQEKLE